MVAKAYIPDGYTQNALIDEVPNLYEAVKFSYRPVLPETVRALMHGFYEKSAKEQGQIIEDTLTRHIIKWDLCDHEGNILELSVVNLRHIKKLLKDRLFNIVKERRRNKMY